MLNLLISIIGKSFSDVNALERNNFNYERAQSLFDIELTMGDEDRAGIKKYIYYGKMAADEDAKTEAHEILLNQIN